MKRKSLIACCVLGVFLASTTFAEKKAQTAVPSKVLLGGAATVFSTNANAYSLPSKNIPIRGRLDFSVGNSFFRNPWVVAPASTKARDGLGPLFNTNGCQNCHIKDGRGHPPANEDDNAVSYLLRLSVPAQANQEGSIERHGIVPEPSYGEQLSDFANPGIKSEGQIRIDYDPVEKTFADGEKIELRQPIVNVTDLAYGEMHPDVMMSARVAQPMIGLGLLEAIADEDVLRNADPEDQDGDGISGRPNYVWDVALDKTVMGRFGWKAGQPNVKQQNAAAFVGDIGITSSLFKAENCTPKQTVCDEQPNGGVPEVSDKILDQLTFYTRNLAVPARRNSDDKQVMHGEKLFAEVGCNSCHKTDFVTRKDYRDTWLAGQTIHPYTDLLLHDMGEGLADHRPEFEATGREWRTPPLWGIGLAKVVNKEATFLHDGRARNLMEAVLWHGGEAQKSTDAVLSMSKSERTALVKFLQSL